MVELSKNPFFLQPDQINWVQRTLDTMTLEEKVQQLFVQALFTAPEKLPDALSACKPGGMRCLEQNLEKARMLTRIYQENSCVPQLIPTNCDNGGDSVCTAGTYVCTAAGAAAAPGTQTAYDMGYVAGREARAAGFNWLFNPCADIFLNWRNTIVNTRCFGETAARVSENATAFLRGAHESGVACCAKHFPGDGSEERDQHLVMGCNDLTAEAWEESYGSVYRSLIEAGVESIMVGHIAQPAMSRKLRPGITDSEIMPATLAPELLQGLLREELGFNGLIITDSIVMTGFTASGKRSETLPQTIVSGCDMILGANDTQEDHDYLMAALRDGRLTEERVNEAVTRILALKAKLRLYESTAPLDASLVGCADHLERAARACKNSITLVKDTQKLLPVDPNEKPRARLIYLQSTPESRAYTGDPVKQIFAEELERAGFTVDIAPNFFDLEAEYGPRRENAAAMSQLVNRADFAARYDVVFLVLNLASYALENNTRVRWSASRSNERPWYVHEVPTVGISLFYTTHLFDVPQLKTFVNAYHADRASIRAAIEKITGKDAFHGKAGESVFCGRWETRL